MPSPITSRDLSSENARARCCMVGAARWGYLAGQGSLDLAERGTNTTGAVIGVLFVAGFVCIAITQRCSHGS
jgi:hypothetical protein